MRIPGTEAEPFVFALGGDSWLDGFWDTAVKRNTLPPLMRVWERGFRGMCEGESRILHIPPGDAHLSAPFAKAVIAEQGAVASGAELRASDGPGAVAAEAKRAAALLEAENARSRYPGLPLGAYLQQKVRLVRVFPRVLFGASKKDVAKAVAATEKLRASSAGRRAWADQLRKRAHQCTKPGHVWSWAGGTCTPCAPGSSLGAHALPPPQESLLGRGGQSTVTCAACAGGRYQDTAGQAWCKQCPRGQTADDGNRGCTHHQCKMDDTLPTYEGGGTKLRWRGRIARGDTVVLLFTGTWEPSRERAARPSLLVWQVPPPDPHPARVHDNSTAAAAAARKGREGGGTGQGEDEVRLMDELVGRCAGDVVRIPLYARGDRAEAKVDEHNATAARRDGVGGEEAGLEDEGGKKVGRLRAQGPLMWGLLWRAAQRGGGDARMGWEQRVQLEVLHVLPTSKDWFEALAPQDDFAHEGTGAEEGTAATEYAEEFSFRCRLGRSFDWLPLTCVDCAPGRFSAGVGRIGRCEECPLGRQSGQGAAHCLACPGGGQRYKHACPAAIGGKRHDGALCSWRWSRPPRHASRCPARPRATWWSWCSASGWTTTALARARAGGRAGRASSRRSGRSGSSW